MQCPFQTFGNFKILVSKRNTTLGAPSPTGNGSAWRSLMTVSGKACGKEETACTTLIIQARHSWSLSTLFHFKNGPIFIITLSKVMCW